jgi:hypothetical protein
LLYFLYKYEHGILKPVEVTLRMRYKGEKKEEMKKFGVYSIYGNVTVKLPVKLSYTYNFFKTEGQEGKTGPVQVLGTSGRGRA